MLEGDIFKKLADGVAEGDVEKTKAAAREALANNIDAYKALMDGCSKGMALVSQKYQCGEAYVPEIMISAEAMYAAMDILKPHIKLDPTKVSAKVVLGVVEGDIHDIGKNIVKLLLEVAGFRVVDLGADVVLRKFIDVVKEEKPDVLALSALMTTTMLGMPETINMLKDAGVRANVKVIVGGAPLSAEYAEKIGADGYAKDGAQAVQLVENLVAGGK
jgi:corrinoid protein of di/trimethylamine methyltransferase